MRTDEHSGAVGRRARVSNWIRISFESIASSSAKYRPDVDGLRAVAVLAVLFFHTGFAPSEGGSSGFDIFYVISGYLITSILAKDLAEGKFSIVRFTNEECAAFSRLSSRFYSSVSWPATVLFDPREMIAFGKALVTTTFFVSNFFFWHSAHPLRLFRQRISSQALLHTWSLAVENSSTFSFR